MILKIRKPKGKLRGKINKDTVLLLLEYPLLFLSTICITGLWMRYGFGWAHINQIKALIPVFCILVIGIVVFFGRKTVAPKHLLYYIAFFTVCNFVNLLSEYPDVVTTVYLFAVMTCFLLIAYFFSQDEIELMWKRFTNIIFVIAGISLLFYIFGTTLNIVKTTGTVTYTWDWERKALNYYGIYYAPTSQKSDTFFNGIQRNCGIFAEGTMFAFHLIIAYMMEACSSTSRKFVKIILLVTLLTTFSTTGIFAIIIFEGIRLIGTKPKRRFMRICKKLFLPAMVFAALCAAIQLAITKMSTGSFGVRYDHIITCLQAFWKTFPVGLGYNGADALKSAYYYSQGTSVGIPLLLAYGGLGGALLLIVPSVLYCYRSIKMKKTENLAFAFSFIWTFFFTNVVSNSVVPWMVITVVFIKGSYDMRRALPRNRKGFQ